MTPTTVKKAPSGKDIWDTEFLPEGAPAECIEDHRQQPEYDVKFKQNVGTEDVFLGMSGKTEASNDEIVVTINLPETKGSDIDLNVTDEKVSRSISMSSYYVSWSYRKF